MGSIYISHLDESINEKVLIDHFSQYGYISNCQLQKLPDGRCKGHGKLVTKDTHAYRTILGQSHFFNGKKAKLEPYLKNPGAIFKKEREIAKKRICVMNIPKFVNDRQLGCLFERFGSVNNAYIRIDNKRSKNHGFVTFNGEAAASAALEEHFLVLGGKHKLQIRPFKSRAAGKGRSRKADRTGASRTGRGETTVCLNRSRVSGKNRKFEQFKSTSNSNFGSSSDYEDSEKTASRGRPEERHQPCYNRYGDLRSQNLPSLRESEDGSFGMRTTPEPRNQAIWRPERLRSPPQLIEEDEDPYRRACIKNILHENPQIQKIDERNSRFLELFYFNEKERTAKTHPRTGGKRSLKSRLCYNYDSIAKRFYKRIDGNHHSENVVLEKAPNQAPTQQNINYNSGARYSYSNSPQKTNKEQSGAFYEGGRGHFDGYGSNLHYY